MKRLVIVGAGEFAEIAFEYFSHDSEYEVAAFSVDAQYIKSIELEGRPVVPYEDLESRYPPNSFAVFVAIPSTQLNRLRTRFYNDAKSKGYRFASYVSSRAFVWRNAKIGENTFVFENNVIQPFVTIGNNCVLWSGNHVGHRSIINDNVFVTSHVVISGYCNIGDSSFIGVNATINDHVTIGARCVIGSGALIAKDTDPDKIYATAPARAVPGKSSQDTET
jgi:sugar O-acyltransferase (sialic acid O-acetyltransferase NeuD family)